MKRKPNNPRARVERACRALLSANHVAVVNIDPTGKQGLINYKNCKSVAPGRHIANAICDMAHRWTIYFSGLCIDQGGQRYYKSQEIALDGIYKADQLEGVIETYYRELLDGCNPAHLVGSGWVAIPGQASLDEAQAAAVFEAVGAWEQCRQLEVAA